MIKITLGTAIDLLKIVYEKKDQKTNFQFAYKIVELSESLEKMQKFFVDEYNKLIKEYSSKDEKGNTHIDKQDELNEKIKELSETEVEINTEITLDDISNSNLDFSISDIYLLKKIIKKEDQ